VAKGWVPLAFGTDTGGSVRVPAAYCGIYGFRLPPNDWALDGVFPLAPSYDSVGWFTQTAEEMSRISQALLDLPEPNGKELRVLSFMEEHHPVAEEVRKRFPQAVFGHTPEEWGTPSERVSHYNVLQSCEAHDVHRDWIEPYADQYSPAVRKLLLRARNWTQEQKENALEFEKQFLISCNRLFAEADVVLLPVSSDIAPLRPMTPEQRSALLEQTTPGSLGRLPVLTVPVKVAGGSLGLQCMFRSKEWERDLSRVLSCF
jgi:amidase/aspartyl-tRNA(Asn)/glutamyl-tRNA(Gln) amidotransferase subunit A